MIPKVIHYCWFGGKPLPKSAIKCISSWRRFFPDYEIKEWNESNFDVNAIEYTRQAYELKKYAFVSDYARFWILYNYGGMYFDTDVEVVKPMNDIIDNGPFMGIEVPADEEKNKLPMVAPGLGLGAELGMEFYKNVMSFYGELEFVDKNGNILPGTVVSHNTNVLEKNGLKPTNNIQHVAGITIYPRDYFNPLDDATGRLNKTANTRTIHWYDKTWVDNYGPFRKWATRIVHRIFGTSFSSKIKLLFAK